MITENRLSEIYNFLDKNRLLLTHLIWYIAMYESYGNRIWLNNITEGELELNTGNNPKNKEDSILIYDITEKRKIDKSDKVVSWYLINSTIYKCYLRDDKIVFEKENQDHMFNLGANSFWESFYNDIINEIREKFYNKKEV